MAVGCSRTMLLTFSASGTAATIEHEFVSDAPAFRVFSGGPWLNALLGEILLQFEPTSLGPGTARLRWRASYGPGEPMEELEMRISGNGVGG